MTNPIVRARGVVTTFCELAVTLRDRRAFRERVRDGTGLRLAIAKRLVGTTGGTIGAASERGRGIRFWFTLPRSENPPCVS